jgi:hypothetical protein
MGRLTSMVGKKFARLLVLRRADNDADGKPQYICRCDCGKKTIVRGKLMRSGKTKSCGCAGREARLVSVTRHGGATTLEYKTWRHILDRCHNRNSSRYDYYGARGIYVCDEWRKSFPAFLNDMGPRPTPAHTIDRIDNSLGYSPSNCRWATRKEQSNNKRNNRRLEFRGAVKTVAEWSEVTGIKRSIICSRLDRGLPTDKVLQNLQRQAQTIEIDGITKSVAQWCREAGRNYLTARHRLRRGWSPKEAIFTPT